MYMSSATNKNETTLQWDLGGILNAGFLGHAPGPLLDLVMEHSSENLAWTAVLLGLSTLIQLGRLRRLCCTMLAKRNDSHYWQIASRAKHSYTLYALEAVQVHVHVGRDTC